MSQTVLHSSTPVIITGSHHAWLTGARPQHKPAVGSPSPKDFQLLWSTHYVPFLTFTFILKEKYTNTHGTKHNKKRFNSFLGRFAGDSSSGLLIVHLRSIYKCPHPTLCSGNSPPSSQRIFYLSL